MNGIWIPRYDSKNDLYTKILIEAGHTEQEPLVFEEGGPHEEGWSSSSERYWMDEHGFVFSSSDSDGCDCDGRMSSHWDGMWNGRTWVTLEQGQRDYQAEAAGY